MSKTATRRWQRIVVSASILGVLVSAGPSSAINIILNYDAGASVEPAADPTGAGLIDLFEYAEDYYEDVFEDTHTITLNFWWEDLDPINPNFIGLHNLVSQSGGRETVANIRLDNDRTWFIDPTPENNSEFNMQQTLWRDLSSAQRSDFYNNFTSTDIPDTFEVGFRGTAPGTSPGAGVWDLLSTVMHEVGHSLGMSAANNTTVAETGDGDYDFNPDFVFGETLAAESVGGSIGHIDVDFAMMCTGCAAQGLRRLPSHTDLFSMASGHFYSDLDVPRREFYGGSDWNTDGNWSGDTDPGGFDDVYVRSPNGSVGVNLSGNGFAANVFLSEGSDIDTESFKLDVADDIIVSGFNTDLITRAGGEVEADLIHGQDTAEIRPTGGTIDANRFVLDEGVAMIGHGTVEVDTVFRNNGTVTVSGGDLNLSGAGIVWDLDGTSGDGIINVTGGNLIIFGMEVDAFDGTINISGGNSMDWFGAWTFNSGDINLNDGNIGGSTLITTGGTINVDGASNSISASTTLNGTTINVADPAQLDFDGILILENATVNTGPATNGAPSSLVDLNNTTNFTGGTLTLNGVIRQNGTANVTGATTVSGGHFDMDGGGSGTWNISSGLTLNVDGVESTTGGDAFNGTLNINGTGGELTVNTPSDWTMAGTMNIDTGTTVTFPSVSGQDFVMSGQTNIDGGTRFDAIVTITGDIDFNDSDSRLALNGGNWVNANRIDGGTVTGAVGSTLRSVLGSALYGNGTIAAQIDFLDDTRLMADDGTLLIIGQFLELGTIGTLDADGTLDVANSWNTGLATELHMNGGTVTGATITNDGTTRGFGSITTAAFVNDGITSADGGTLIINTGSFPDLDGTSEVGTLNAVNGSISVPGVFGAGYGFDGTMNIQGNSISIPMVHLFNNGSLTMNGGTLAAADYNQRAALEASGAASTIDTGLLTFQAGSTNQLNTTLQFTNAARVEAGANFSGAGDLRVNPGTRLDLDNLALVDVQVVNRGRMAVGSSPGVATVDAYAQSADGIYEAEIDGLNVGTGYDQLNVVAGINLDGRLEVDVNANGGAYADPVVAGTVDAFVLMIADSVAGRFSEFEYDGALLAETFGGALSRFHIADGLFRVLAYEIDEVSLLNYKALPGDANGDLIVDGLDFIIWNENKFTAGTDWLSGDFNGDGITDGLDYIIWNENKFTGVGFDFSPTTELVSRFTNFQAVPEPGSTALGLMALFGLALGRRRNRN